MKLGNRIFYITISIVGLVILGAILIVRTYRHTVSTVPNLEIEQIIQREKFEYLKGKVGYDDSFIQDKDHGSTVHYFAFDPNDASYEDFIQLGLTPKVAKQIIKYRNTGAQFRKPEDFSKIYALSERDFERLKPYIKINIIVKEYRSQNAKFDTSIHRSNIYTAKTNHPIDANKADKEMWMKQKGIGEGFANRILAYRDKLGGFVDKEQLKEVYGLPDSTYQNLLPYINIDLNDVRKINVNTASLEELSQHPYIGKRLAENIVKLRSDMEKYNKIEDLRMVPLINEEKYRKIAKYLIAQ
jgi:competence protein ComEA